MNEEHTKEEYEKKLAELNIKSCSATQNVQEIWKKMRIEKGIYRDMYNLNCEDSVGNNIKNSKNCHCVFNAGDCENCSYLYDVLEAKMCQDLNYSLYHPEVSYELISTLQLKYSAFSMATHYSSNVYYCDLTQNSHDLFGCIGLNHKEFCILNKQYTKEEYEQMIPKIMEHMMSSGEWGQFFPVEISPFAYNETVAQEYIPLLKQEIEQRGWKWTDEGNEQNYMGPTVEIPDTIDLVDESICEQVLICEISKKPFKITPQELKFYKQQGISIPRRTPTQRHLDRMALRNPRKLWSRNCAKCKTAITTSYNPNRPEAVYCEACYLSVVK